MNAVFKSIATVCLVLLTSFFFFPINVTFLPSVNSKMALAAIGLVLLGLKLAKRSEARINQDFLIVVLFACGVSVASYFSIVLNGTPDTTYVSYVVSMLVWTMAAYTALSAINLVHSRIDVELICYYLAAVCVFQCIIAILIDTSAPVKAFIDSFYVDSSYMNEKKRLYGLGAALDIAGGRFGAVLIMISFMIIKAFKDNYAWNKKAFLLLSYGIIVVIGNMIGRTTTMGMMISIGVFLLFFFLDDSSGKSAALKWILTSVLAFVVFATYKYNTDQVWKDYLEFGFEGFFSLARVGKWEVHSNDMLMEGFIYPDNLRCWLIGDGYFEEASVIDQNYVGETWYGFYKGTDAGYSRFLFYFGLVGLSAFSLYFIKACHVCMKNFSQYKFMFVCILLMNFVIWVKASTDLYPAFAPFIALLSFMSDDSLEVLSQETDES
ncbi:MAG: hypothetical protein MJZ04_00545 [Bacteroidales bacterium]|nr:hypothetical protein [Bacteroidales bacterium]